MCHGGGGFRLFSVFPSRPPYGGEMNAKILTAIAAILVVTVCLASIGPVSDAAEVGNESDLSTQIGEAPDSTETEIKLTADITLNSTLTIPQGKIIVLNLNNSTLTTSADAEVIINNGTLTVKNGYVKANDSGSWSTSKSMHGITNNGTLTVDQDEGYTTKIDGYRAITNYGTTTVNDGTIDTHYRYGIWSDSSNAVLTVNGGIFTASKQGEMARTICTSGTVNIYGGTFTSTGSSGAGDGYVDTIRIYNSGSVLTIDPAPGKTVTVTSETDYAVSVSTGGEAIIKGGTYKCEGVRDEVMIFEGSATIQGGSFAHEPDASMISENCYFEYADGLYIVHSAMASTDVVVSDYAGLVQTLNGSSDEPKNVIITGNITIPSDAILELKQLYSISVPSESALNVDGILILNGSLNNEGALSVGADGFIGNVLNVTSNGVIDGLPEITNNIASISTPMELQWLTYLVANGEAPDSVILESDIALPEQDGLYFTPIGSESIESQMDLDGRGYTISNLNVYSRTTYGGLFGVVLDVYIHDVKIADATISSTSGYIGAVAGLVAGASSFSNIIVSDSSITSPISYGVGGLFGQMYGNIDDSLSLEEIIGCTLDNVTIEGYANTGALWGTSTGYPGTIGAYNITLSNVSVSAINVNSGVLGGYGSSAQVELIGVSQENVTVKVKDEVQENPVLVSASSDANVDDDNIKSDAVKDENGDWVPVTEETGEIVATVNGAGYTSLASALVNANDGDTVKLLVDTTLMQMAIDKGITLDLGGNTLTISFDSSGTSALGIQFTSGTSTVINGIIDDTRTTVTGYTGFISVYAANNGTSLTLIDVTVKQYVPNSTNTYNYAVRADNGASLTVSENVQILEQSRTDVADTAGVVGITLIGNGTDTTTLVVDGATINTTGFAITGNGSNGYGNTDITIESVFINAYATAIYHPQYGKITVNGGTIESEAGAGLVLCAGELTVNGGNFITNATEPTTAGDSGHEIMPSAIVVDDSIGYPGATQGLKATIEGGSFTSATDVPSVIVYVDEGDGGEYAEISDGTFSSDVSDYCADGFTTAPNSDGTYGITESVTVTFDIPDGDDVLVEIPKGTAVPSSNIPIASPGYVYGWTVGGSEWDPNTVFNDNQTVVAKMALSAPTVSYEVEYDGNLGATITVDASHPVSGVEFTYSATSPAEVSMEMDGNKLYTQLPGEHVISVTAADPNGLSAITTVTVPVSFEDRTHEVSVVVDIMPGQDTETVTVNGISFGFENLVHGNLGVAVFETESEDVSGYGTPSISYEIVVAGSAWTSGEEIQITVPISVPDGQMVVSGSVVVLYIPEEGSPVDMDADVGSDGESIVFTTTHNSKYAVFYDLEAIPEDDPSFNPYPGDDDDYVPLPPTIVYEDDGSDSTASIAACAAAAVVAAILAIVLASTYRRK